MELGSLQQLFVDELKDLYSAENQILKALPKMAKAAESRQLQQAFREHLKQTEGHVKRLRRIFDALGKPPTGKKCKGMEGLLSEGAELMKEDAEPPVMDAGLISAAQRVEHYEIAAYGTVRTYAQLLEEPEAAELLQQTLDEEKQTDVKLSELADSINVEAEAPSHSQRMRASNGRLRGSAGKRKSTRR
ncbi:MAG: ferritin-like domain-containing protein [Candidatus Eremiobacter antarcticus]|nr:ferritin-like domain-containing protein [Candidatus Eremiobacteraeota bacterium]PZR62387.1 MAG: ferritin-like domain-containing protein [Candidatus Eremiobacter sp. RRmetagenome_bin22]